MCLAMRMKGVVSRKEEMLRICCVPICHAVQALKQVGDVQYVSRHIMHAGLSASHHLRSYRPLAVNMREAGLRSHQLHDGQMVQQEFPGNHLPVAVALFHSLPVYGIALNTHPPAADPVVHQLRRSQRAAAGWLPLLQRLAPYLAVVPPDTWQAGAPQMRKAGAQ